MSRKKAKSTTRTAGAGPSAATPANAVATEASAGAPLPVKHFDIIIVGGGLVGATLALSLARYGLWQVALVEKTAFQPDNGELVHPSFDARNTALSNGTCELFEQLGLWQALKPLSAPIRRIDVSDQGGFGRVGINADEEQVAALGYVIENRHIGRALLGGLTGSSGVTLFAPAEFSQPRAVRGGFTGRIHDANGEHEVRAALLVVADGADSPTCSQLGIGVRREPYGQQGIVTTVLADASAQGCAWERFTPEGPLAILPQTEGRLGITWCVAAVEAERLMALDDEAFLAALQQKSAGCAGTFAQLGQRQAYPLRLVLAEEQIRPHLVVLGNAAHGLHPVAGQGLNMALRDVVVLVRVLVDAARAGRIAGDFSDLQQYLAQRATDQRNTIQFSDKLTRLFSNDAAPVRLLRNAGLALFDVLPGAKHMLARHAMGRAVEMKLP